MWVVEIPLPLLAFIPGWPRVAAAVGIIALMGGIQATGNYGYFNLLTIVMCIPLFAHAGCVLTDLRPVVDLLATPGSAAFAAIALGVILPGSLLYFIFNSWVNISWSHWPVWLRMRPAWLFSGVVSFYRALTPLRIVQGYGVFPPNSAPGQRWLVQYEATDDGGETWHAITTPFLSYALGFVAPYHPRVDQSLFYESGGMNGSNYVGGLIHHHPYAWNRASAWNKMQILLARVLGLGLQRGAGPMPVAVDAAAAAQVLSPASSGSPGGAASPAAPASDDAAILAGADVASVGPWSPCFAQSLLRRLDYVPSPEALPPYHHVYTASPSAGAAAAQRATSLADPAPVAAKAGMATGSDGDGAAARRQLSTLPYAILPPGTQPQAGWRYLGPTVAVRASLISMVPKPLSRWVADAGEILSGRLTAKAQLAALAIASQRAPARVGGESVQFVGEEPVTPAVAAGGAGSREAPLAGPFAGAMGLHRQSAGAGSLGAASHEPSDEDSALEASLAAAVAATAGSVAAQPTPASRAPAVALPPAASLSVSMRLRLAAWDFAHCGTHSAPLAAYHAYLQLDSSSSSPAAAAAGAGAPTPSAAPAGAAAASPAQAGRAATPRGCAAASRVLYIPDPHTASLEAGQPTAGPSQFWWEAVHWRRAALGRTGGTAAMLRTLLRASAAPSGKAAAGQAPASSSASSPAEASAQEAAAGRLASAGDLSAADYALAWDFIVRVRAAAVQAATLRAELLRGEEAASAEAVDDVAGPAQATGNVRGGETNGRPARRSRSPAAGHAAGAKALEAPGLRRRGGGAAASAAAIVPARVQQQQQATEGGAAPPAEAAGELSAPLQLSAHPVAVADVLAATHVLVPPSASALASAAAALEGAVGKLSHTTAKPTAGNRTPGSTRAAGAPLLAQSAPMHTADAPLPAAAANRVFAWAHLPAVAAAVFAQYSAPQLARVRAAVNAMALPVLEACEELFLRPQPPFPAAAAASDLTDPSGAAAGGGKDATAGAAPAAAEPATAFFEQLLRAHWPGLVGEAPADATTGAAGAAEQPPREGAAPAAAVPTVLFGGEAFPVTRYRENDDAVDASAVLSSSCGAGGAGKLLARTAMGGAAALPQSTAASPAQGSDIAAAAAAAAKAAAGCMRNSTRFGATAHWLMLVGGKALYERAVVDIGDAFGLPDAPAARAACAAKPAVARTAYGATPAQARALCLFAALNPSLQHNALAVGTESGTFLLGAADYDGFATFAQRAHMMVLMGRPKGSGDSAASAGGKAAAISAPPAIPPFLPGFLELLPRFAAHGAAAGVAWAKARAARAAGTNVFASAAGTLGGGGSTGGPGLAGRRDQPLSSLLSRHAEGCEEADALCRDADAAVAAALVRAGRAGLTPFDHALTHAPLPPLRYPVWGYVPRDGEWVLMKRLQG
jgi:hypothetical protein